MHALANFPPRPWQIVQPPDEMHYSQMTVEYSDLAFGNETMQYGAKAATQRDIRDIHSSSAVY